MKRALCHQNPVTNVPQHFHTLKALTPSLKTLKYMDQKTPHCTQNAPLVPCHHLGRGSSWLQHQDPSPSPTKRDAPKWRRTQGGQIPRLALPVHSTTKLTSPRRLKTPGKPSPEPELTPVLRGVEISRGARRLRLFYGVFPLHSAHVSLYTAILGPKAPF